MIHALAIANYRSLLNLTMPFGQLNVITGENGSGKSNLYKALRLLAETAQGGVVRSLANEGGLHSTFWAGPETISAAMKKGTVPVEGTVRQKSVRLRLGFATEEFGYAISLGLPTPGSLGPTAFAYDPEIKRESVWAGSFFRTASALVDRQGSMIKARDGSSWQVLSQQTSVYESIFSQSLDPERTPELITLKQHISQWRFYDHFRSDQHAPARTPQLGTRTPVLSNDGADLAAALQTIIEIGDQAALERAIADAFPGARLSIQVSEQGLFHIEFYQHGLLRPLSAAELSDGTLRFLLWIAALLTPRPPPLMVLNEPETSLHPDLLPALARLIIHAANSTQVWVISHANRLINALEAAEQCESIHIQKILGET